MIRFYKNHEIDKEKWDQCIDDSFNGIIYAYSWYLDIVAENWSALVEDDYQRVFPLYTQKKYGIPYIYQPFLAQQLGVFSKGILSEEINRQFIKSIPRRFKVISISFNTFAKFKNPGFKIKINVTHELDLIVGYEKLYKSYSTNLKRNLKKAARTDLTIIKNVKPNDILNLHLTDTEKKYDTFSKYQQNIILRVIYKAIHRGQARVIGATNSKNQLIAGVVFLLSKNKSIFILSGNSDEGRKCNAIHYLLDNFIKENASKNLTLDFEGSQAPNLARFYKSFGSKAVKYHTIKINRFTDPVIRIWHRSYF